MDMMTEVFNVGDKVECVRDSPDNNDSIAIGVQGVICVIVDSSPHIGVRWNEKVVGGHDCHGACSHGYGWFVTPCDIKRIDDDCEFKSHYPHHGALLTNMTGARLPANGFPIESTPVMTK